MHRSLLLAGSLALALLPGPSLASDDDDTLLRHFLRRNPLLVDAHGIYDPTFALEEMARNAEKYSAAATTYQQNFRAFEAREREKREAEEGKSRKVKRKKTLVQPVEERSLAERYRKFEAGGMDGFREAEAAWSLDSLPPSDKKPRSVRIPFEKRSPAAKAAEVKRAKRQQSGQVALTSFYQAGQDAQYTGDGTIGTPGQSFILNFDTGVQPSVFRPCRSSADAARRQDRPTSGFPVLTRRPRTTNSTPRPRRPTSAPRPPGPLPTVRARRPALSLPIPCPSAASPSPSRGSR